MEENSNGNIYFLDDNLYSSIINNKRDRIISLKALKKEFKEQIEGHKNKIKSLKKEIKTAKGSLKIERRALRIDKKRLKHTKSQLAINCYNMYEVNNSFISDEERTVNLVKLGLVKTSKKR